MCVLSHQKQSYGNNVMIGYYVKTTKNQALGNVKLLCKNSLDVFMVQFL